MAKEIRELIEELRRGDRYAFNSIYDEYTPLVRSLVSKYCGSESPLDEDMTQEALIALYNSAMSYDLEQSEVSFGLYTKICISNRIISAMRKKTAAVEEGEIIDRLDDSDSDPSKQFDDKESARLLAEKMLSLLSEYERSVFKMYIQDVPISDIARTLGKTSKSVDNALSRIKNKLRRVL